MAAFVAFRLANWDTPLWASPNRRDSRYGTAGSGIVQYWALHPLTPWAEYLRYHAIRQPDEVAELRVRPWDWSACQAWARNLDVAGLVVPSAALPGTKILVLFGHRVRARWGVTPLDPGLQIPCEPVADLASGVLDLLDRVRFRGDRHTGLEAWKRGEPEPIPPRVQMT